MQQQQPPTLSQNSQSDITQTIGQVYSEISQIQYYCQNAYSNIQALFDIYQQQGLQMHPVEQLLLHDTFHGCKAFIDNLAFYETMYYIVDPRTLNSSLDPSQIGVSLNTANGNGN